MHGPLCVKMSKKVLVRIQVVCSVRPCQLANSYRNSRISSIFTVKQ